MKKLILIALASLSLISCRKDDDEKEESLILGTWKTIEYRYISGKDGSIIYLATIPETDCLRKSNYIYKNNGKFVTEFFYNSETGECGNIAYTEESDYVYNESEKTISYKFDNSNEEITKVYSLTKTEMQILIQEVPDHNNDGIDDKIIRVYKRK